MEKYSKKNIFLIVAVVFVGLGSVLWSIYGIDHVTFSENQAREQVLKNMPFVKNDKVLGFNYEATISDVFVDFLENDKIHMIAIGTAKTSMGSVDLEVDVVGQPILEGDAFYFKPDQDGFRFTKFEFSEKAKVNTAIAGKVLSNLAKKFTSKALKGTGVKINKDQLTQGVKNGTKSFVENLIVNSLNSYPIKKLDGTAGIIVTLGVTGLTVNDNEITVNFSLLKFTGMSILILLGAIATLAAVMTMPMWGVAIMSIG